MKAPIESNPKLHTNHLRLIIGYIAFCLVVLLTVTFFISSYVSRSNTNQINNILSLMSEKVNTSFEMMTDYIIQAADMISARDEISFEEEYEELQHTLTNMPYFSIGLIDMDGTVYGIPGEQMDMEKHGFCEAANGSEDVYISEPYRSSVTGSNMITLFAPIYQKEKRVGSVFVTYYLETIQNLAYTNILSDETAVFLMNPYSGNFVNCSDDGTNPPGTWSNIRLTKSDIKCFGGYDYDIWIEDMKRNASDNIVNFEQNGISYTQAYVHINGMDNWSLVIRIPIGELSSTMQQYMISTATGAALLILATMFLAANLYRKEHDKTLNLQMLSNVDPLTKVMNRRGFNNVLKKLFSGKTKPEKCTFMFIDIDLFKHVNDNHGHDAGDFILTSAASILREAFDEVGMVARVGGDEFNVLVTAPISNEEIETILRSVQTKFGEIILPNGTALPITYSAGLSQYPKDAEDLTELINCADKALYHVKENGRNNFFWY